MRNPFAPTFGATPPVLVGTVDEVHRSGLEDLRQIGSVLQHLFRDEQEVAFVAAGLPSTVSDLLNADVVTFLRRADRRHLNDVSGDDVRAALREPIVTAGKTIDDEALEMAVKATGGYLFLIQLVGYQTWRAAQRDRADIIGPRHAQNGATQARRKIGQMVHAPALKDLSDIDRTFLTAMAVDDGPSRMRDLGQRLGVNAAYAGQYRLRLLDAEMIRATGHGRVDFTLPGLRTYLRDHAASTDHWDDDPDLP